MTDRRLEWVAKNRTRRDRTRRAGDLMGAIIESGKRPDDEIIPRVVELLAVCVDDEFRAHCRIAEFRGGLLRVHVDAPTLVSAMRGRWRTRICSALKGGRPGFALRDVFFTFGRDGAAVGA